MIYSLIFVFFCFTFSYSQVSSNNKGQYPPTEALPEFDFNKLYQFHNIPELTKLHTEPFPLINSNSQPVSAPSSPKTQLKNSNINTSAPPKSTPQPTANISESSASTKSFSNAKTNIKENNNVNTSPYSMNEIASSIESLMRAVLSQSNAPRNKFRQQYSISPQQYHIDNYNNRNRDTSLSPSSVDSLILTLNQLIANLISERNRQKSALVGEDDTPLDGYSVPSNQLNSELNEYNIDNSSNINKKLNILNSLSQILAKIKGKSNTPANIPAPPVNPTENDYLTDHINELSAFLNKK